MTKLISKFTFLVFTYVILPPIMHDFLYAKSFISSERDPAWSALSFSKDLIQKKNSSKKPHSKTVLQPLKSNGCLGIQPNLIELNFQINLAASCDEFNMIWHLDF